MRVAKLLASFLVVLATVQQTHHVCCYYLPTISSRLPGWKAELSSRYTTAPSQQRHNDLTSTQLFSTTDVSRNENSYYAGDEDTILTVYEAWRQEYLKGDFDNLRYQNFRENYIKLMTANAAELTVARDMGCPDPIPLTLNEFGDLSPDEYGNLQNVQSPNNGYQNPTNGYQNPASNNGFKDPQSNNGYQNPQSANADEQDRIRRLYQEWCVINQKVYDEARLPIFTTNLQVVENFYKETGQKAELNQFADLSPEEYQAMQMGQNPHLGNMSTQRETPPSTLHQYFDEPEVERIKQAYQDWCGINQKVYDEARLDIFATNLLAIESFRAETGKNAVLNEYADLAPEEYNAILSTGNQQANGYGSDYAMDNQQEPSANKQGSSYLDSLSAGQDTMIDQGIRAVYQDWCVYYEKLPSEEGLYYFTQNYQAIEKHYRETGEELTMDQYADLSPETVAQEKIRIEEEMIRAQEELRLEEARLEEERSNEERLAEEARLKEKTEEQRLEAARLEENRLQNEESKRLEMARRNEEERKKAEELLRLEEERKQQELEAQRQKQEEERAKFEEATRRVEEAQLQEQRQAAAAAQTALEERRARAAGEMVQETIDANPRFADLDVEKERLRKERMQLEQSLASDRARLEEEKRREEEAKAALEETNRQIDELMKESENETEERSDPIILPRGSYMDAVAKTWVDRTAYLEALQQGRAGALPYNPQFAEDKPKVQVEMEKQEIKKSESLIDSIWNFMKESSMDDTGASQYYSNRLIQQADELISDTAKKSTGVMGEELRFLKQAVDAMRRRNNDELAADQARTEAKEWEKIQQGLEKEAKLAKQRRERDERVANEARRKARTLKSEHRKQQKRAEEARREERTLRRENKQTEERIRNLDPAFGGDSGGQENPFGFFPNPFEGGDNKEFFSNPFEGGENKDMFPNPFQGGFFGGSESDEDRNSAPVTSMTQPVKREKKVSWLDAVFGFLAGEEPVEETPGMGTITLEPAKRTSVFDLFVSPESIAPVREPGRGSITIEDPQESSIFSFFARFGISNKKEKFIDPVRRKRVMDYESKLKTRQDKLSRLKAGRSRILQEKDKRLSRKEARKLQRELDELAAGDSTSSSRSFNIPQLVKWTRTPDGRITGWISDASGGRYRMGTKITTSPIKGNIAKPGMTVTTISGSEYRLGMSAARRTLDATSDSINKDEKRQSNPIGSIFGGWFNEEAVPSLVEWIQNEDGTITGFVNNKEGFEDGTQITTSPVPQGARKGMMIQTKGGSKYKLMRKGRNNTFNSPRPPPY